MRGRLSCAAAENGTSARRRYKNPVTLGRAAGRKSRPGKGLRVRRGLVGKLPPIGASVHRPGAGARGAVRRCRGRSGAYPPVYGAGNRPGLQAPGGLSVSSQPATVRSAYRGIVSPPTTAAPGRSTVILWLCGAGVDPLTLPRFPEGLRRVCTVSAREVSPPGRSSAITLAGAGRYRCPAAP
jgi:hypothetical protein